MHQQHIPWKRKLYTSKLFPRWNVEGKTLYKCYIYLEGTSRIKSTWKTTILVTVRSTPLHHSTPDSLEIILFILYELCFCGFSDFFRFRDFSTIKSEDQSNFWVKNRRIACIIPITKSLLYKTPSPLKFHTIV